MISLVGYTGFVGSNLAASFKFDGLYNSKNVSDAFGTCPDILYYAGVPAQKFIANKYPKEDMAIIKNAVENIKKINLKKIVLISTVDVYQNPNDKDENSLMETQGLLPYGMNRLALESFVEESFTNRLIVRLPGLYGKNLKKNFIYDFLSVVPAMLTDKKIQELGERYPSIYSFYDDQGNGFYKLKTDADNGRAKELFQEIGFTALNFTDSRGVFQFYNLEYLYDNIQTAMNNGVKKLNIATEPVCVAEVYKALTGESFVNETVQNPPYYNFKTVHSDIFNGKNGYIQSKEFVLEDIKKYVDKNKVNF
ncbi:MAG: NAD-dependent epimerase/dehydratase family protein [Oscillospiraceae bacterium]